MSNIGYQEIIEYIAEECMVFANAKDELEADVDRYMESLTEAVQRRVEELGEQEDWDVRSGNVVEATYTSVWDGGVSIESSARANIVTRTVEIGGVVIDDKLPHRTEIEGVETLDREFVTIDGQEYEAMNERSRNNYSENEQNKMFFYQ